MATNDQTKYKHTRQNLTKGTKLSVMAHLGDYYDVHLSTAYRDVAIEL